jgi:hypothetical protein
MTTALCILIPERSWRTMLLLALGAALLAACSSNPSPGATQATRTPKPTFTMQVQNTNTPTAEPTLTPQPTPTTAPSPTPTVDPHFNPLTGQMVEDPGVLQRRPLLVRIGNDPEIRPQSGLSQADMVFEEAIEDFTGTRFTAVIWSKDPEILRPIRSARLLTIQLGHMFDGALVHSGANDQVRWLISQTTLTDLDQYFHDPVYFWIDPTGAWKDYIWMGRVGTSAKRIRDYLAKKGKEKAVQLTGFQFSDGAQKGEPATYVHIPYPKRYLVEFRYDTDSRLYKRFVRGEPHTDAINGQQLAAANVIIHYARYERQTVTDAHGSHTFDITFTGEGRAQIFRDGVMIEAKWVRPGEKDFVQYLNLDGAPVLLRPGQTWVEVVPPEYQVTFKVE